MIEYKAKLLSIGKIRAKDIPSEMIAIDRGGPGAGAPSIFLRFGKYRVRLKVTMNSPLELRCEDMQHTVYLNGERYLNVKLEKPLLHCPEQAYVMVSPYCTFGCKYCSVSTVKVERDIGEVIGKIDNAASISMRAVSLTSGIPHYPLDEIRKTAKVVRELRERFRVPIGVSVYPAEGASEVLFQSGASEVKYNIETFDREIFKKVCPNKSQNNILRHLEEAVHIFGEGKVFSNIIIGLGEEDRTTLQGVEKLASMGVVTHLRPLSQPTNMSILTEATSGKARTPTSERILSLAVRQQEIFNEYGLIDKAETMCGICHGCEIDPSEVD